MSQIEWILFDLGGVLLEVQQSRIFNHLQSLTDIPAPVIEERMKSAAFFLDDFMVREFSPQEISAHVNDILGQRLSTTDVVEALNAELGPEISTTANLLPTLQRRAKVGCLSNTNSIHWDKLLQAYPFMGHFDRRFASQILGCAKPGREIYEKVTEFLNVQPRQILFVDDKPENVETAQRLGWHAHVYAGHEALMAELARFEVA
jgi:HAD superfamily hydrolase (TIGR01509 family)